MKSKIFNIFAVVAMGVTLLCSCTDMDGDGNGTVIWEGSVNPENNSFHNPVWEPSLDAGTIVRGAGGFTAISTTTQWANGVTFYCPTLNSNNLSTWTSGNQAFIEEALPAWAEGRINSITIDYARAVTGATYWMFYTLEGQNTIGAATATTAAGPYVDKGEFLKAEDLGATTLKDPFLIVASTSYFLAYTTENGTYLQRLTLKRSGVTKNGQPTLIANTQLSDVAIVRVSATQYYLVATCHTPTGTELRYGKAEGLTGPYLDKAGDSMAETSVGEQLIVGGTEIVNPENPMRGFLNTAGTHIYLAYNATEAGKETMQSGYARKPLFIAPLEIDEDGWFKQVFTAQKGWTQPLYE